MAMKNNKAECFKCGFRMEIDQLECPACSMGKLSVRHAAFPVDEKELNRPYKCHYCGKPAAGYLCSICQHHGALEQFLPDAENKELNNAPDSFEKVLFKFEIPADMLKENQIYKVVIYGKK